MTKTDMSVAEKIRNGVKSHKNILIVNKTVKTVLQETGKESENNDAALLNLKPDIIFNR